MDWLNEHLISTVVFFPFIWAVLGLAIPTSSEVGKQALRYYSLVGTLVVLMLSLRLFNGFLPAGEEFQFVEKMAWLPALGTNYFVGIDGISLLLILLTTCLAPVLVLSSFTAIQKREREYYFYIMALQTGMLGALVALDTFLFYIYWEVMLIPMYFLVGIWGGKERIYAATKFFLYTMAGSLLMLIAIFFLAYQHKVQFGAYSTAITDLYALKIIGDSWTSPQSLLFLAFSIAFAIKVPLFPLHTWLPDAHVQAPTAGSVVLAAVLLKMGGYGFIRFAFPLFPDAVALYQLPFMILGGIAIVYGACVAMVQPDIKKLVAYSSVSHMGYVVIGLFALNEIGATGAIYQMLSHGVSTGALFLLVGMIYERRHTREIDQFGGIAKVMPLFAIAFMIVTLSAVALPGTNGFVGEFLILLGTWQTNRVIAVVAGLGVILGAVYMLWMFQRVMLGPIKHKENEGLKDLSLREMVVLAPFIFAIFFMGVKPNFFFSKMEPSIERFLARTHQSHEKKEPAVSARGKQQTAISNGAEG